MARSSGNSRRAAPTVAILGAGASGICMGVALKRAGISSFRIYEKSDRIGGTWYDNSYPGAACDVPSHLYCFSFEPNPGWTRRFSPQPEIRRYLERCAEKYGLTEHISLNNEIEAARFDEASRRWTIRAKNGQETAADVVVTGTGQLNRPSIPDLPGLSAFEGAKFHSARWNHSLDLRGRRVAVIGNGASAVQFVPEIAPLARELRVFQRSPNWIVPRDDRAYTEAEQAIFRNSPRLARFYRDWIYFAMELRFVLFFRDSIAGELGAFLAKKHMEQQIADPALRAALTPDYPIGCKRILASDDYYPALTRPNVRLVTSAIQRVAPDGIVTNDGASHPADTIIFGTGFESTSLLAPLHIEGLGGRSLNEACGSGAEAYLGLCVPGFPNFFMLYGPNTNLGHNSILFMIECQVGYVMQCIEELAAGRAETIDVRPEAMARFNEGVQRDLQSTSWAGSCRSWYKDASGKIINNWPGFTLSYWWRTRRPDFGALRRSIRDR